MLHGAFRSAWLLWFASFGVWTPQQCGIGESCQVMVKLISYRVREFELVNLVLSLTSVCLYSFYISLTCLSGALARTGRFVSFKLMSLSLIVWSIWLFKDTVTEKRLKILSSPCFQLAAVRVGQVLYHYDTRLLHGFCPQISEWHLSAFTAWSVSSFGGVGSASFSI